MSDQGQLRGKKRGSVEAGTDSRRQNEQAKRPRLGRSKTTYGRVMPPPRKPHTSSTSPLRSSHTWSRHQSGKKCPTHDGVLIVALTGGPCAGKSTALSYLSDQLTRRGCIVHTCVESATLVMSNGAKPPHNSASLKKFQVTMLDTVFALEGLFTQWAQVARAANPSKPNILICDRGCMDGKSFVPDGMWDEVMAAAGVTEQQLLARYDMVLHLVTAAIGAESFYEFGKDAASNPNRFHDCAGAAAADKKTLAAWSNHPRRIVVDNSTDFSTKVHRVLAPICSAVGLPPPKKLTRVVLVHDTLKHTPLPVHAEEFEVTIIALPSLAAPASVPLSDAAHLPSTPPPRHTDGDTHAPASAPAKSANGTGHARTRTRSTASSASAASGIVVGHTRVSLIRRIHGGGFAYTRREQHMLLVPQTTATAGAGVGAGSGAATAASTTAAAGSTAASSGAKAMAAHHVTVTKRRPIVEREFLDTIHSTECGAPVDEKVWCFHVGGRFFTLKRFGHLASNGVLKLEVEVDSMTEDVVLPPFLTQVDAATARRVLHLDSHGESASKPTPPQLYTTATESLRPNSKPQRRATAPPCIPSPNRKRGPELYGRGHARRLAASPPVAPRAVQPPIRPAPRATTAKSAVPQLLASSSVDVSLHQKRQSQL